MSKRVSEPATLALRVAYPPAVPTPRKEESHPWGPGRASRRPNALLLAVEVGDDQGSEGNDHQIQALQLDVH